jgi:hypothetical protein
VGCIDAKIVMVLTLLVVMVWSDDGSREDSHGKTVTGRQSRKAVRI